MAASAPRGRAVAQQPHRAHLGQEHVDWFAGAREPVDELGAQWIECLAFRLVVNGSAADAKKIVVR